MVSSAVEDYLKTIYKLRRDGPVATKSIAQAMGVSPASVTNMVKRLAGLKMVTHESYKGVSLTPAGEKIALEILRHHRLLETYLREVLGYSWEKMHAEAELLEHHISEEFEEKIDELLGYPRRDPHGHPIPSVDLEIDEAATVPLSAVAEGKEVSVYSVADDDTQLLEYLESIGLMPDSRVTIESKARFDGPITLKLEGQQHVVGYNAASRVFVTMTGSESARQEQAQESG